MAYIEIIHYEKAEGTLKEIYKDIINKRGKLAAIHKAQSLNPESIVRHMDLYIQIMFGSSPLKRYQREMIGVVTSVANNCDYCQLHHGEALNHFWKDDKKIKALREDFRKADLNKTDMLLCTYAWRLTKQPSDANEMQIKALKNCGLSDRAILDATLVTAYFNFVNRIVLGLGIELETHQGKGFLYD